jgi:hypothetical protein
MKAGSNCTPGRVGHVFFFPEKSYATLKGKEGGWSENTNGGLLELKRLGMTEEQLREDVQEDAEEGVEEDIEEGMEEDIEGVLKTKQ